MESETSQFFVSSLGMMMMLLLVTTLLFDFSPLRQWTKSISWIIKMVAFIIIFNLLRLNTFRTIAIGTDIVYNHRETDEKIFEVSPTNINVLVESTNNTYVI